MWGVRFLLAFILLVAAGSPYHAKASDKQTAETEACQAIMEILSDSTNENRDASSGCSNSNNHNVAQMICNSDNECMLCNSDNECMRICNSDNECMPFVFEDCDAEHLAKVAEPPHITEEEVENLRVASEAEIEACILESENQTEDECRAKAQDTLQSQIELTATYNAALVRLCPFFETLEGLGEAFDGEH